MVADNKIARKVDFRAVKKKNYFKDNLLFMSDDEEDFSVFLEGFGFSKEELNEVMDELSSYRSIPGTTLARYMNRILDTIADDMRPAFLKGIMVGVAIRTAVDATGGTGSD